MIGNKAIWSLVLLAILGDISAHPAIGARVYCKYGSAITGSDGIATIADLPLAEPPDPPYLVTACAQGYKSKSQLVTVTAENQATATFALESQSGFILSLTANPTRIAPDGISTSAITARVTDLEGAPLAGKSVTITTDMSTFQENSTNTVTGDTSDQGILSATLISLTTPNTATLTATCGTLTAQAYVEFAENGMPSVRIVYPAIGETIVGSVSVRMEASSGVDSVDLLVDGQLAGAASPSEGAFDLDTPELSNGSHTLQAIAFDGQSLEALSPVVLVTSDNLVYTIAVSGSLFNPANSESLSISGTVRDSGYTWTVRIDDHSTDDPLTSNEIWSTSGTSQQFAVQWSGVDNAMNPVADGPYRYAVLVQADGQLMGTGLTVCAASGSSSKTTLAPGQVEGLVWESNRGCSNSSQLAWNVVGSFRSSSNGRVPLATLYVPWRDATWEKFESILAAGRCGYLFLVGHGIVVDFGLPPNVQRYSGFHVDCARAGHPWGTIVLSSRPDLWPPPGTPFTYYGKHVHYLTELGLASRSQMILVGLNCCKAGYIGSQEPSGDEDDPYAIAGSNDLACEFGIYNRSDSVYLSFHSFAYAAPYKWMGGAPPLTFAYTFFSNQLYGALANNLTVWQALRFLWIYYDFRVAQECFDGYPFPEHGGTDPGFWDYLPPYYNFRVFGNPYAKLPG